MQRWVERETVGDADIGRRVGSYADTTKNQHVGGVTRELVSEAADVVKRRPRHTTVVEHEPAIRKAVFVAVNVSTAERRRARWRHRVSGIAEIVSGVRRRSRMDDHSDKSVLLLAESVRRRFRSGGSHRDAERQRVLYVGEYFRVGAALGVVREPHQRDDEVGRRGADFHMPLAVLQAAARTVAVILVVAVEALRREKTLQ